IAGIECRELARHLVVSPHVLDLSLRHYEVDADPGYVDERDVGEHPRARDGDRAVLEHMVRVDLRLGRTRHPDRRPEHHASDNAAAVHVPTPLARPSPPGGPRVATGHR